MPRRNRNATKAHRYAQRSKVLRALDTMFLSHRADAVTYRTYNPRGDERGSALVRDVVTLLCVAAIMAFGLFLTLAVFAPEADAKAVEISPPKTEMIGHDPLIYIEQLDGPSRWFYGELADGSQWMFTRCRIEESRNCWWNAHKRGNHHGHSFVDIHGAVHYLRTASQP